MKFTIDYWWLSVLNVLTLFSNALMTHININQYIENGRLTNLVFIFFFVILSVVTSTMLLVSEHNKRLDLD